MALVENLKAYLARLRDRPGLFAPPSRKELEHLHQHLRARFEELQLHARHPQPVRLAHVLPHWHKGIEDLASEVCWRMDELAIREDERMEALCLAIDLGLPRDEKSPSFAPTQTKIWHHHLRRIVEGFSERPEDGDDDLSWERPRKITRYASELRLTLTRGDAVDIAPMGEVLLQLVGRDAIRWILAVEVVQSCGPADPWRISRRTASELAHGKDVWFLGDEPTFSQETLARYIDLDLLYIASDQGQDYIQVTPLGLELLDDASTPDTPFTLMARAMVTDHTQAVLATVGNDFSNAAAEATVRHTRMVAHEIRNALVPVRIALKQLWRDLGNAGQEGLTREPRQTIDGNIERIFRFLDESIRLSRLASAPPELFELLPAIHDAIRGLDQPPRGPIEPEIASGASAVRVRGHRQRLVLALVNLLRNAVQAGGPDVSIGIQVTAVPEQKRIQIVLDDDGPGIAPEQRTAIFQNGVSHRSDGTGHGLTLVREVIEREMSGKIACEGNPLGGARFVIELPWA